MKAIVRRTYGSPDVLRLEEMEKPTPAENEVRIKVCAAAVNPYDWHFVRGTPYFLRLIAGLRRPKSIRLGVDVAGQVESVGKNVSQFRPGDSVFGACNAAFAEYACVPESKLARKPDNITFEQAGSVAIAGLTALQVLRDKGHIQAGQSVLIIGASGGVGTFAVQIAKSLGAQVTGVCSTRNVEMVRSIGADRVIDYTREDLLLGDDRYDLVAACAGNHSFFDCRRILKPQGVYVGVGGGGPELHWMIGPIIGALATAALSAFVSQKAAGIIAKTNQADLVALAGLMASGKLTPIIDRTYSLAQVADSLHYLEQGHARGKVVITTCDARAA